MTPTYIVIHHSLTMDSGTVSWGAIRRYHTETCGWKDIGYHWGVEQVGDYYEILVGRTMEMDGAHCVTASMNTRGIGVCCVGNFDLAPPPPAQLEALTRLVAWLQHEFYIPRTKVIGHRDAGMMVSLDWHVGAFKSCPGKLWDLTEFRKRLPV